MRILTNVPRGSRQSYERQVTQGRSRMSCLCHLTVKPVARVKNGLRASRRLGNAVR